MDWNPKEVELIVKDYFHMLRMELEQKKYNKSNHRANLLPQLNGRSPGSVEFKHQNISAVLVNMGLPYIKGYKPRFNYQRQLLEKEVAKFLYLQENQMLFEKEFEDFSEQVPLQPIEKNIDFESIVDDEPPQSSIINREQPLFRPIKVNYLEKEQNNRKLGERGENLIIRYEKWRLIKEGKENLAEKVEWVSKEKGDGAGFDILSKNINGTDRYIEVKTTKLSKENPIYLTSTELQFASKSARSFYLYRVFNFDTRPQFFIRQGSYDQYCRLQPITFKGYF